MRDWIKIRFRAAISGAASLTGKRFGLLVASSLVATAGIVAAAATNEPESSPAATMLASRLFSEPPAAAPSEAEPEAEAEPEVAPEPEAGAEPEPVEVPSVESVETPVESYSPPVEQEPEPSAEESKKEEGSTEDGGEPDKPDPTPPAKPEAGQIKHVFLISLSSSGYAASFEEGAAMPFLATKLRPKGELLTHYTLLDEAALPNGIATISGQPPNAVTKKDCPTYKEFPATAKSTKGVVAGAACVYPVLTLTLPDQLEVAQFTWRAYMEGMKGETGPENCVHPEPDAADETEPGGYSARLNPFPFFHSLLDLGSCSKNDVPLTELNKDLKSPTKTANFSYISPTPCAAGIAGECPEGQPEGPAAADAWLEEVVPEIMKSPAYKADGLIIVTFGSVSPPPPPVEGATPLPQNTKPLRTGALLISKAVVPNATDDHEYDPYSLLRSVQQLFGLEPLAKAGDKGVSSFGTELRGEPAENGGD